MKEIIKLKSVFSTFQMDSILSKIAFWASFVAQLGNNPPAMAGNLGLIPGLGRCPGEGKGYLLQYSGLENSMDYSPWGRKELDRTE